MKLPEFRRAEDQTYASRGTSMRGAFMTPQLRPQTQKHVAAQASLTAGMRDVDAERRAAMSENAVGIALADSVVKLAGVGLEIDNAFQTMNMEKAASEHSRRMTDFASQEMLRADETDPETGRKRWESFDERYQEMEASLREELREEFRFQNRELEHKFSQKTNSTNYVNRDNLRATAHKGKIAESVAKYEESRRNTVDPAARNELDRNAYDLGLISAAERDKRIFETSMTGIFDDTRKAIETDQDGLVTQSRIQMVKKREFIDKVGADRAEKLYKLGLKRLGLLHSDNAFGLFNPDGSKETLKRRLAEYSNMKPEDLGVENDLEKQEILKVMEAEMEDRTSVMVAKAKADSESMTLMSIDTEMTANKQAQDEAMARGEPLTPGTAPYDPDSQKNYNKWKKAQREAGNDPADLFSSELNYRTGKAYWIENNVIPKDTLDALNQRMNVNAPPDRIANAAGQLVRYFNDRQIPSYQYDKALKVIGKERLDLAHALSRASTADEQRDILESYRKPVDPNQAKINWSVMSKDWEPDTSAYDNLPEGFGIDKDQLHPVFVAQYEAEVKRRVERGLSGNSGSAMKTYEQQAMSTLMRRWGMEADENGDPVMTMDTIYRGMGADAGTNAPIDQTLMTAARGSGNGDWADLVENNPEYQFKAVAIRGDNQNFYLRVKLPDGSITNMQERDHEGNPTGRLLTVNYQDVIATGGINQAKEKINQDFDKQSKDIDMNDPATSNWRAAKQYVFDETMSLAIAGREVFEGVATIYELYKPNIQGAKDFFGEQLGKRIELDHFKDSKFLSEFLENREYNDAAWQALMQQESARLQRFNSARPPADQINPDVRLKTFQRILIEEYGFRRPNDD